MKVKLITFKATPEEQDRFREAAKADGKTVSEVCRAALERLARRVEKREGVAE